jgi:hypothetical protein
VTAEASGAPISQHAFERATERLGVPKRAVLRLADRAWEEGHRQNDYRGSFARFLGDLGAWYHTTPVVYHGHVYAFGVGRTLVTVYPVPSRFRNHKPRRTEVAE